MTTLTQRLRTVTDHVGASPWRLAIPVVVFLALLALAHW